MQKFILTLFVVAIAGCAGGVVGNGVERVELALMPTTGSKVTGRVTFARTGEKLRVVAEVSGLTPGLHGFHIHEFGDCSASDGGSAGGHFNPAGARHGSPDNAMHHAGDMPQLVADASGVARLTAYLDGVSLADEAQGIRGRSVVVHAQADDFKSQPAGNAGARLACGVIPMR
ncbi:MAG: superoxide dismutase family protein [Rhodocyclales bacterium GT-UBC]|nr:MAG: superoxide dismutase family protein [Rhodocyclales bacterium GT-UBC]